MMAGIFCKSQVFFFFFALLMLLQPSEEKDFNFARRFKRQSNNFLLFSNGSEQKNIQKRQIFSNRQSQLDPNGFFQQQQQQQNQNQFSGNPFFQQRPNQIPNLFNQNQFDSNSFFPQQPQPVSGSQLNRIPANPRPSQTQNNQNSNGALVFINNRPTIATMAPFVAPTRPSTSFLNCFNSCPTTPQYNPICGSNQQLYFNEQKFNCARSCGADIQIVRRGSCEGLVQMQRG